MRKPTVDRAPVFELSTPSAELIRHAGSQWRAWQRIQAAAYAAVEEAERLIPPAVLAEVGEYGQGRNLAEAWGWDHIPGAIRAVAALLCRAEVIGQGGPLGLGGSDRGTRRYQWAAGLGSGRAHSGDGPAWTAAIRAAADLLWPEKVYLAPWVDEAEDGEAGVWTPEILLVLDGDADEEYHDLALRGEILGLLLPLVGRLVLQQVPKLGDVPGLDRETPGVRSIRDGAHWPVVYDLVCRDAAASRNEEPAEAPPTPIVRVERATCARCGNTWRRKGLEDNECPGCRIGG